jgi:hypothetical protein
MSRTFHHGKRRQPRRLRVRGVRKDPPDARGVARALISLVQAQAEADPETARKSAKPASESARQPTTEIQPANPESKP